MEHALGSLTEKRASLEETVIELRKKNTVINDYEFSKFIELETENEGYYRLPEFNGPVARAKRSFFGEKWVTLFGVVA